MLPAPTSQSASLPIMSEPLSGLASHLVFGHFAAKGIKKGLSASLAEAPLSLKRDELSAVMQSISWKAGEIMVSDAMREIDPPSRGHLEWSAWILSAWQVLRPRFESDEAAIEYLGAASLRGFDTWMVRLGVRLLLRSCKNNPARAKAILTTVMKQFGVSFNSDVEQTDASVTLRVTKCFYMDFFAAHGVPALTTVLCRLDQLWFKAIDPAKHGMVFDMEHYVTMSRGATQCCFPIVQVSVSETP